MYTAVLNVVSYSTGRGELHISPAAGPSNGRPLETCQDPDHTDIQLRQTQTGTDLYQLWDMHMAQWSAVYIVL